ncbi:MAG: multicopper oxidase family protein [Thermomicrobiales bacterium]
MNRRRFARIAGSAMVAAGIGYPLARGFRGSTSAGSLLVSDPPLPPPFQIDLPIPQVLQPMRQDHDIDYYEIVQKVAKAAILPGVDTEIWGYNGTFPGPTIVTQRGRKAVIRHTNRLPVPTVVHLHGGRNLPADDGFPIDFVYPKGSTPESVSGFEHDMTTGNTSFGIRDYVYTLDQPAATLWYHDHRMDFTGPSIWKGLAGFHLHHDAIEKALGLPAGNRDLPLMITDRSFATDGSFHYPSLDQSLHTLPGVDQRYMAGVLGDVILVNGAPWPIAHVSGNLYRLRLLNASNARRYRLALDPPPSSGNGLVQIGSDGGLLPAPIPHDAIDIAPAERFDVIVDFSRYPAGSKVTLINEFGTGSTSKVMQFAIGTREPETAKVPKTLADVPTLTRGDAVTTRTLQFRQGDVGKMRGWTINGEPFSPDHVHATVQGGTTEIWRLMGDFHHPIHIHLNPFQVLSRGLNGPGAFDRGWKDTIDLRPAEQAEIIIPFAKMPGKYVFHCHTLEHEDMAMMANFVVK